MTETGNTRNIHFVGYDLGRKVTLMLAFEPPNVGTLYHDEFPLCWAVVKLGASGRASADLVYNANTVFFVPQARSGNIVSAGAANLCSTGQKCEVQDTGDSFTISNAVGGITGFLECKNATTKATDIGIGFADSTEDYKISPSILWTKVPSTSAVKAKLTPVLKAYETGQYKVTEMIKGNIESPELWRQDLMKLGEDTTFNVTIDPIGQQVIIKLA